MSSLFRMQLSYLGPNVAYVRVEQSPKGEPRHRMLPPFDPETVRGLLQVLEKRDLSKCRFTDEESAALRALGLIQNGRLLGAETRNRIIGDRLFEALFPQDEDPDRNVRAALDAALATAQGAGEAVPLQLRFDRDAVDLVHLPWELLYYQDEHLVASGQLRFTRYITFGQATAPFPVADRLEVLVVTARPVDTPFIDPTSEQEAIRNEFRRLETRHVVRVHMLAPPTLDALVSALNARPYHVVHFDGHGAFARRCPFCEELQLADLPFCSTPDCGARLDEATLQGCLAFERSESNRVSHLVTAAELATALSGRQVRLFVASACQSGTVGGLSVFSGVGPRLILAGVPAVVAMQFSVPVESAVAFAGAFYAALARGESVAAAAAAGRGMLKQGTWYIPAVYLRNQDGEGHLFRFEDSEWVRGEVMHCDALGTCIYLRPTGARPVDWAAMRPREAAPYKFLNPYEATDAAVFHGRDDDTQRLLAEVLHRPFMVVHGPRGVGKTSLIHAGLIPALLEHGYAVLTVREYGDPVEMLSQAVEASAALDVNVAPAKDLSGLVGALVRDVGRPLVVVFDQFEQFVQAIDPARTEAFITQFADCARASHPLPVCLLLVLRQDFLGRLSVFAPHLPGILANPFPLRLMSRQQAEQAIVGPLDHHLVDGDKSVMYDSGFLDTLLSDLCSEDQGNLISPTHLQIVCHELYQSLRQHPVVQGKKWIIGPTHYPQGGTRAILSLYLRRKLQERFPEPAQQELAAALLKQMVKAGERAFVAASSVSKAAGVDLAQAKAIFEPLLQDGLLELRSTLEGVNEYSLSHDVLAEEVDGWFDRDEALNQAAQQTLERAWDDWYAGWYLGRDKAEEAADERELLVGPDRLQEIRERREGVRIEGLQFCLLLQSAVHHRIDMGYWARQFQGDGEAQHEARHLLEQIHSGPDSAAPEEVNLAAEALGLERGDVGESALARGAVAHGDGTVRHTAALALASLGLDAVHKGLATLSEAAPTGRLWRRVQALAQIKAADFPLPELPSSLRVQVNAWRAGIRLYDDRWRLMTQAIGSGLGGGLCLMLLMAAVWLGAGYANWGAIYSYLMIGAVVGASFAGGRWMLEVLLGGRSGRILGGAVGFCLGLILLLPYIELRDRNLLWLLLGGLVAGAAVAAGWDLLAPPSKAAALRRKALGGALGGALAFAVTALSPLRLPYVLEEMWLEAVPVSPALVPAWLVILAALAGAATGTGLAGGGAIGQQLWRRFFEERVRLMPTVGSHPVEGEEP